MYIIDSFLVQGPKILVRVGLIVFNQFAKFIEKEGNDTRLVKCGARLLCCLKGQRSKVSFHFCHVFLSYLNFSYSQKAVVCLTMLATCTKGFVA